MVFVSKRFFVTGERGSSCFIAPTRTVMLCADPTKYVLQDFTISSTVVRFMMDRKKALDFACRVSLLKPLH